MLDDLAPLDQGADGDAVEGAAVVLGDDGILGDVDQTAGQVTGVGGLEGGVRQTFTGAVGRDEVLQHGQTFAEVGGDRRFDDLAGRLGHQSPHPGQLADLLLAEPRAPESAIIWMALKDGTWTLFAVSRGEGLHGQVGEHLLWRSLRCLGPDVDDLVVALAVGDQTFGVLVLDLLDLFDGQVDDRSSFPSGITMSLRQIEMPARVAIAEADLLEPVGQDDRLLVAGETVADIDQFGELLLVHDLVDVAERDRNRARFRAEARGRRWFRPVRACRPASTIFMRTLTLACRSTSPAS